MSPASRDLKDSRIAAVALALCFLAALAPILAATMPPIMDFPNHLARIWLIAHGAREAPLEQIYKIDWTRAGANVGVDFAAAMLMRVLPTFAVSKLLVALAFLGPPLGALLLSRALSGRFHALQLSLLALAWSTTAIAGFLNFQISLGLALAAAALVAGRRGDAARSFGPHAAIAALLLFVHPFGVLLYAATVAALLVGPDLSGFKTPRRLAASLLGLTVAVALAPAAATLLLKTGARPPLPFWGDVHNIVDPIHALTILLSPALSYDLTVDLAAAAAVLALVVYALAAGVVRVHAGLTLAAAALFALAPAAPDAIGDGSWLPQRLPILAALMFLAGLRPGTAPRLWLPVALAVPVLARTLWIASVWMARQEDVAALMQTLPVIPAGSAVITLQQEPRDWRQAPAGRFMIGSPNGIRATGRHLGALAVIEAGAFVPALFSVPGQNALEVAPGWRDIAVEASSIPYPRQLGADVAGDPYLKAWRDRFDYVLVLNADLAPASDFSTEALAALETAADRGFARLYRISKPGSARDAAGQPATAN